MRLWVVGGGAKVEVDGVFVVVVVVVAVEDEEGGGGEGKE